jgi:predicted DNA-binding transcriptional regulator AlpA
MQRVNYLELSQKVLFITGLEKIIGRSRLTLRHWWEAGRFPKPVKLNGTTLAWQSETINDWIGQNIK